VNHGNRGGEVSEEYISVWGAGIRKKEVDSGRRELPFFLSLGAMEVQTLRRSELRTKKNP